MTLYHIGISGGKDSTALLLWAIHKSGLPREELRVSFCNTHNEDPLTEEHLELLRRTVIEPAGIPGGLEVLEPIRGFFDLALHKKRFPSRKAQFCTQHLKLIPTQKWVKARWDEGHTVIVLNGKRMGESEERKRSMTGKEERAFSDFWGCEEWAPLMKWTIEDVLAIHKEFKVPMNPLYALGARRVGCFPCINCGKHEIKLVAKLRPEKIAQISIEEKRHLEVHGRFSSFFASKTAPKQYRTLKFTCADGKEHQIAPIDEIVKWAHTERGGKQISLPLETPVACWAGYNACE